MVRYLSAGLDAIGIRDRPTSPRSPWQNAYAERLIGSIRRECIDHVVVFGERHLRHVLLSYMDYYNGTRTHLSLSKDAPMSRAAETAGRILCRPILGGLHPDLICGRHSAKKIAQPRCEPKPRNLPMQRRGTLRAATDPCRLSARNEQVCATLL